MSGQEPGSSAGGSSGATVYSCMRSTELNAFSARLASRTCPAAAVPAVACHPVVLSQGDLPWGGGGGGVGRLFRGRSSRAMVVGGLGSRTPQVPMSSGGFPVQGHTQTVQVSAGNCSGRKAGISYGRCR